MEQLSGIDSFMLHNECGNVYNHIAGLGIYDPSTAPGGKVRFRDILEHFAARLSLHKLFRRKLVAVPFGIDRPYWMDVADVDVEFHVRHIALPGPGDWRQLMIQVARLHSRPLDRSRPLWEVYVIEGLDRIPGLPPGAFAVYQKYHHASVDGQSAGALIMGLHTKTPSVAPPEGRGDVGVPADREPAAAQLYAKAVANTVRRTASLSSLYVKTVGRVVKIKAADLASLVMRNGDPATALPGFARSPATRFNGKVSAHRVVEAVGLPFADIARVRASVEGSTINDIFLAVVGGGLRHYLQAKGELPDASLVALMPISLRKEIKAGKAAGNEVGGAPVKVHTELADPLARLAACRQSAQEAKAGSEVMGHDFLKSVMDELPAAAADAFMRHVVLAQLNTTVSNVRGPDETLHLAGARLVHFYPVSIATDHAGLNHTGFSYNGVLWISAVACRDMLPDPAFYADCIRKSFTELLAAATQAKSKPRRALRSRIAAPPPPKRGKRTARVTARA
ncbi:MAG: wax ester/triacylglycerol synthase family O-acyltransferase [Burkholderiales bacterium]|nr:wax ester/triacylglycerol synthase family O-acyltransferase [Burkholderiales bacterium]